MARGVGYNTRGFRSDRRAGIPRHPQLMTHGTPDETLSPDLAQRLTDFARACKAATRSVTLYPGGHPSTSMALMRLVESAGRATAGGPLTVTVAPEGLAVDGRKPARPDSAIMELATLLHDHLIGEMRILGAADPASWHSFLQLLGRPTQELLLEGGIGRLWAATGGQHIMLRERKSGMDAAWESIVRFCLEGDAVDLDQDTLKALVEIATDKERLLELTRHVDTEASEGGGVRAQSRALIRLLRLVARAVTTASPELLEPVLQNAAAAAGHLSPEVMLELLTERYQVPQGGLDVVGAMVDR